MMYFLTILRVRAHKSVKNSENFSNNDYFCDKFNCKHQLMANGQWLKVPQKTMKKTTNAELGRPSVEEFRKMEKMPVVVVLDNVRSAQNVGAFFRTGDAFAVEKIALCGITATPPSREIHKSSLGAEFSVEWAYFSTTVECVQHLKNEGYTIVAIEQIAESVMLDKFQPVSGVKYALIFGNEVEGVAQEVVDMCDSAIEIPQLGTKHSLNVSVSGGVVLWKFVENFR